MQQLAASSDNQVSGPFVTMSVIMPDGRRLYPSLGLGQSLLAALVTFGLPLRQNILGCVGIQGVADPSSRSIAGLLVTSELDGLEITLSDDCLEPQTYWIAG